ncbi:response regulator transcription factor [Agreia pratensis]|uniref:response regulator transcription factor n=1 Tax=Agreia pratensis TaxID=150121 RepID=UPI002B271913|nr:response regulator transcription factor [Agreia pratensis]
MAIADDHVLFASGIQMVIDAQPRLIFVGAAHDGQQAVELCRAKRPQIMLMDVRMPKLDGISATKAILSEHLLPTKIIILTTHQSENVAAAAIKAGAAGFLMKDSSPELLISAIHAAAAGRTVITTSDRNNELLDFTPDHSTRKSQIEPALESLSPRERDVFAYAANGHSIADIARAAHLSESTVKTHISNILSKLGLASRLQLVAFAHSNHLV